MKSNAELAKIAEELTPQERKVLAGLLNEDGHNTGRLVGKTALITGGTSGIGEACVRLFCAQGAAVAFTGRRRERGEALAAEIERTGGQARFIPADHRNVDDCRTAVEKTLAAFEGIDILFNNAGIVKLGGAEALGEEDWAAVFDLNVTAVWRMCRLVIPHMRARGGGVILNNASDWGVIGAQDALAYCASKGAVVQMTRCLALDHARDAIRVNALCPGDTFVERWVTDGYFGEADADGVQAGLARMGSVFPMGRVARPEEIARAALFLVSGEASYVTGAALLVDGGNTAGDRWDPRVA